MAFDDNPKDAGMDTIPNPVNMKKSMLANMVAAGAKYSNLVDNDDSIGSKKSLGNMSLAQLEVFSTTMQKEYFENASKWVVYAEVIMLIVLNWSSQL